MKKSLFALTAALMATSSAFAMDVTHPFYVPMKGDFLSDTSLAYTNWEHGDDETAVLSETLSYGITRNFSVNATLADTWLFDRNGVTGHDRYDNPAWGIGLKYNLVDCCKTNWKVQVGANYDQGEEDDHHDKSLSAFAKAGYQIKNFLPYLTLTVDKPVGRYESAPSVDGRLALYTELTKKVSLDAGIDYAWSEATEESHHESAWKLDASLDYAFSDCMSAGLTGEYIMRTKPRDIDAYAVGVNFKVAF